MQWWGGADVNIALVIRSMELGGGSEHDVVHLSAGLKVAGHEPLVVTAGGRLCNDLEEQGVSVLRFPMLSRNPFSLWASGRSLARILEDRGVEVLNPQSVFPALCGFWASRRLLKSGVFVPNIVTIHMLDRISWWYYKLAVLILNRVADHVIVESNCERLRLQQRGMNRSTTVLHNCFPPKRFEAVEGSREEIRREMGWHDDHIVFIMPARMDAQKGHEVLFEALAKAQVNTLPLLVFLAGDGPLLSQHRKTVGRLGLQSKVVFGGFRRDLPKLYKGADVFLLSSHWESLPLSIREGMVAGLPVISTNVAGIPEAVEHNRSGLLVPPGDPAALAGAIAKLASEPSLRRSMGQRGKEISEERFNYQSWVSSTVSTMSAIRDRFIAERASSKNRCQQ